MQSLLIANRGEIAVRIIRACREMGIRSIAVCSEADRSSLHVRMADSYCVIGPAPAVESYLSIPNIINAARLSGADAVHPGYGFLSERPEFAGACLEAGLKFVGPPAGVMHHLGDKIEARAAMQAAGVPICPGYNGADQSDDSLIAAAKTIGAPLLIKAAAGGGGRGMRAVSDLSKFSELLTEARRESQAAFGDGRVFLERYIANARHVEFQIFGDEHGNVVHLFERDCSIQRRHQKIVEESPCPILTPELRAQMADAAVLAGKTAGYVNAGTVEFLLEEAPDGGHKFYFLEVNARLQVEHPVTEFVTGVDLVQLQLQVAAGLPIPYSQNQITSRGHCIETRIYAEDPSNAFMPSTGLLHRWDEPQGPSIRVDSGVSTGDIVTPYYDPMLAKLIVSGATREMALERAITALADFAVLGIDTNIPYLQAILNHPVYRTGKATTRFLPDNFSDWQPETGIPQLVLLALATDAVGSSGGSGAAAKRRPQGNSRSASPWSSAANWRNS